MGNWSNQQEVKKEAKEKDKVRREKLVLGGITPLYTNTNLGINWYVLIAGAILTIVLANIGNLILK